MFSSIVRIGEFEAPMEQTALRRLSSNEFLSYRRHRVEDGIQTEEKKQSIGASEGRICSLFLIFINAVFFSLVCRRRRRRMRYSAKETRKQLLPIGRHIGVVHWSRCRKLASRRSLVGHR